MFMRGACREDLTFSQGICAGAVSTLMSLGPLLREQSRFCPPSGATVGQGVLVVSRYFDGNPEALHGDATTLMLQGFRSVWPCR